MTRLLPTKIAGALAFLGVWASSVPADAAANSAEPAFVGSWAADRSWCDNDPGDTDQVPVRLTRRGLEGYENSCRFIRISEHGGVWQSRLRCEAEGNVYYERLNMRVARSQLVLMYPDRKGREARLFRCPR